MRERVLCPAGLAALIDQFQLKVPAPAVRSQIASGIRRSIHREGTVLEQYPPSYTPEGVIGNLKFALRYEPVDLLIYERVFAAMEVKQLEGWIQDEPTGIFARRAWYLYEQFTGKTLDVPDSGPLAYADLLDQEIHITAATRRSRRHRINDNLLGNIQFCPLIRRTTDLTRAMESGLSSQARALAEGCDPAIMARAVHFLYAQETKSSFAIEGEVPSADRTQRFVQALAHASTFNLDDASELVRLQNLIVDTRYAATGWRDIQNYVGSTRSDFSEHIHFICPRPDDVESLTNGWMRSAGRMSESGVDPVCAAAAASFGFVFIHPFEDGNGRIHRFLIHQVLGRAGFTPEGLLFPVSAVMLRDKRAYDRVLQGFSERVTPQVDYTLDDQGHMTVRNETASLYRYWDATEFAEYLYACVAETIHHDLKEEIGFLRVFDAAVSATMQVVDMPDRRASLLVRLILQNQGTLSAAKRDQFSELSAAEIQAIEAAVHLVRGD